MDQHTHTREVSHNMAGPCSSWWARCAETRPGPVVVPAGQQSVLSSKRTLQCSIEEVEGRSYRRCKEVEVTWRLCAGKEREEVRKRVVETLEPVLGVDAPADAAGPMSSEAGALLDTFFEFANELERRLSISGSLLPVGEEQPAAKAPQSSPSSGGGGLLERWFGKKKRAVSPGRAQRTGTGAAAGQQGDMELFRQYASGPSQEI